MSASDDILQGALIPIALGDDLDVGSAAQHADCWHGDLVLQDGRAARLDAPSAPPSGIVLPKICDPHVHLDKCHSVDRIGDVGGDLRAAIQCQWQDKQNWTEADLRTRASRGLAELIASGCGAVRTHVDWSEDETAPLAWSVLHELAEDTPDVTLQCAALTGTAQLADPAMGDAIARRIARDNGVLGTFVLDQHERAEGIRAAFRLADSYGLALDFHVDEGLAPGLDGVEHIVDMAMKMQHQGPVLLGHACALMNLDQTAFQRVADKIARAGISVVSLPTTNLYLQDRSRSTPDRRGLTRIRELRAAGVTVAVGTDNVRDAFCPIGRHDPRHTLAHAVLGAHLDPPLGDHLPLITSNARKAMGLPPQTIAAAKTDDLLVHHATSTSELLADPTPPQMLTDCLKTEPS